MIKLSQIEPFSAGKGVNQQCAVETQCWCSTLLENRYGIGFAASGTEELSAGYNFIELKSTKSYNIYMLSANCKFDVFLARTSAVEHRLLLVNNAKETITLAFQNGDASVHTLYCEGAGILQLEPQECADVRITTIKDRNEEAERKSTITFAPSGITLPVTIVTIHNKLYSI